MTSAVSRLLEAFQRALWNGEFRANPPVRDAFSPFIIFQWFAVFFLVLASQQGGRKRRFLS